MIEKLTLNRDEERACSDGIIDAENNLPKYLPTWIENKYGKYSEVAYAYYTAYDDTKRSLILK